jgi:hypothetical protein
MARYAKFFSLGGGGGTNNLQLPVGTILDATLRQVQDGLGTGSPLYLSTGGLRVGTTAGSAMYWDDVNNRLGVGTNTPTSTLHTKGVGTTSTTTSLLIQNSSGGSLLQVKDNGLLTSNVDNEGGAFSIDIDTNAQTTLKLKPFGNNFNAPYQASIYNNYGKSSLQH